MPLQFANPVWVDCGGVELDHHVQHLTLPPPGSQAQLEDCVGRLHGELLDRSRPLWRVAVIDGLHNGQVGYYFKMHHAVFDGQAGVLLARLLFDDEARPRRALSAPPPPPAAPAEPEPALALRVAAALKHDAVQYLRLLQRLPTVLPAVLSVLWPAVLRSAAGRVAEPRPGRRASTGALAQNFSFGPRTPINGPITGERGFAGVTLPLAPLKRLAELHDAKLNDIVLALCGGALRRYLARHGGIPRKPLIAIMPVSLREAGNTELSTQATLTLVNLNTHRADPLQRLRAIRDAAAAVKTLAQRARGLIPMDFPSIGLPWLLQAGAQLYGRWGLAGGLPPLANVVVSNVPGPQAPLYVAGARMVSYWPLSIVEHGVGLNITVMSYAGTMGFGFTTARSAVPEPRELAVALQDALDELLARSPKGVAAARPAAGPRASRPRLPQ
jgi:WS/DGAT/MGAT family acyltransferase